MQGKEGSWQARPGGQSHLFLEQELVIRAGSLHPVLRDASFPSFFFFFFPLRVDGSEGIYTEGREEIGPQSSKSTAWTFATFPRVREGLKFELPLEESQRLVDSPQQPCGRVLKYLLFSQTFRRLNILAGSSVMPISLLFFTSISAFKWTG